MTVVTKRQSLDDSFWRPGIESSPAIDSGFKHPRLRVIDRPLPFQVVLEKGQLDLLAILLGGLQLKGDIAMPFAGAERPSAMLPRTHDQVIARGRRAGRFDLPKRRESSGKVLSVEPAANGHDGGLDIAHVSADVPRLAVFVVRFVFQDLV